MMVRGGISGTKRLARHLWRMCFALFIASASVFLARPHLFPAIFRKSGLLVLLTVASIDPDDLLAVASALRKWVQGD